jgi:hypothetical protein
MKNDALETNREIKTNEPGRGGPSSDDKPGAPWLPDDPEEMRKRKRAASLPGPAHRALHAFAGEWKVEVECYTEHNSRPQVSHGWATGRRILNGHFVEEDFHGEIFGQPVTGRWLIGYDNSRQKFTGLWLDDAGTALTLTEGRGDGLNQVITLEGKTTCAVSGRTDLPLKQVFRLERPDRRVCELYVAGRKNLEIVYTRQ